ncbi:MAG TPA: hypothetical protein VK631_23285, partial [Solirubrobacteraceae bacterium]|nr:hypothetical protein [Solirubrobacteraceae bacterium]
MAVIALARRWWDGGRRDAAARPCDVHVAEVVDVAGDEGLGGEEERVVAVGCRVHEVGVLSAATGRDEASLTIAVHVDVLLAIQ